MMSFQSYGSMVKIVSYPKENSLKEFDRVYRSARAERARLKSITRGR